MKEIKRKVTYHLQKANPAKIMVKKEPYLKKIKKSVIAIKNKQKKQKEN